MSESTPKNTRHKIGASPGPEPTTRRQELWLRTKTYHLQCCRVCPKKYRLGLEINTLALARIVTRMCSPLAAGTYCQRQRMPVFLHLSALTRGWVGRELLGRRSLGTYQALGLTHPAALVSPTDTRSPTTSNCTKTSARFNSSTRERLSYRGRKRTICHQTSATCSTWLT